MYLSLFLSIMSICSRGFFEVFLTKSAAYIASVAFFILFYSVFVNTQKFKIRLEKNDLYFGLCLLTTALGSALLSLLLGAGAIYTAYIIYPIVIVTLHVIFSMIRLKRLDGEKVYNSISLVAIILVGVATAQQFGLIDLPGATPLFYTFSILLERPSSLTGSYLHYPLVISLTGMILYALKGRVTLLSALCLASPFLVFSRSGMIFVMFVIVARILVAAYRNKFRKALYVYVAALMLITTFALIYTNIYETILQVINSFGFSGLGNEGRFNAWARGLAIYSDTNLLLGEKFGEVTNLSSNLFDAKSTVVESGLLQNLINFGLLGTIAFYGIFLNNLTKHDSKITKLFVIAFLFQNLFYQSHEVVPFVFVLLLFLSVSKQLHSFESNSKSNS